MKIYLSTLFILSAFSLSAQKATTAYLFDTSTHKIPHSLYSSIELLDERDDTSNIGVVQKGAFNRKENVVPAVQLNLQLQDLVKRSADETAGAGKLILVLKDFQLTEFSGGPGEKGYCYLQAFLYTEKNGQYLNIASIDSLHIVTSLDVTKELLKSGRSILPGFITDHLTTTPWDAPVYTLANLQNADSMLKSKIPLYAADTLRDGIYKNYQSFKMQVPEVTDFEAFFSKKKFQYLAVPNKKGKYDEPLYMSYYAFVYKGKPYITTSYGTYPLEKRSNDFFFKGKYNGSYTAIVLPGLMVSVISMAIMQSANIYNGEAKIVYKNGAFSPLKKEKAEEETKDSE